MAWNVSATPDAPEEAIRWFRERVPMTDADFRSLRAEAKRKAFTVAGIAELDLVAETYNAIGRAISDGTTLDTFKQKIAERLRNAWSVGKDTTANRLETIFRTNVQGAYGAGRYEQQSLPSVRKFRPYWMLDVTRDSRQSTICKKLSDPKIVLPADDPFWKTHVPPLHFRCRSAIRSLRKVDAEKIGLTEKAPDEKPDEGFGLPPGKKDWKPNMNDYPTELAKAYRAKRKRAA